MLENNIHYALLSVKLSEQIQIVNDSIFVLKITYTRKPGKRSGTLSICVCVYVCERIYIYVHIYMCVYIFISERG